MYRIVVDPSRGQIASEIVQTAHKNQVNSIAFPYEYSECFATGELRQTPTVSLGPTTLHAPSRRGASAHRGLRARGATSSIC